MENSSSKKSLLNQWKNREHKEYTSNSILKAPEGADIPLTSGQQRLWFLQQLLPENPVYNYPEIFAFKGELQLETFKQSLKSIFKNNSILRSSYHFKNGKTIQKINEGAEIKLKIFDLSNLTPEEKQKQKSDILLSDAKLPFILDQFPLVRATLIKLKDSEHVFLLTVHHIIFDKWSMNLFISQLADYYRASLVGVLIDKSDINTIDFSDYAFSQNTNGFPTSQLDYWKLKLGGDIPLLDLPTDFPLPRQPSYKGTSYRSVFSKELSKQVLDFSKQMETTPYVLLLSAYYLLLHKYSGQTDIIIGSPISQRGDKALEEIIGFMDETVVLRTSVSSNMTFSEFVKEVRKTVLEAFSNKEVPFEVLVKELSPRRSLSINPFFRVMFIYHSVEQAVTFGPNLSLSHSFFNPGISKFDLTLYISNDNGILSSGFEYATDIFEKTTIIQFQEHLTLLLEEVTTSPNQKIKDIVMLTSWEKKFYLNYGSNLNNPFENYLGIHNIIENIAIGMPNKIALTFKEDSISYEELNRRSTWMASEILKRKKKRNEIIGLSTDRSMDMIVGLLAILKAGCAYLPLDPNYPEERLNFMLTDAECKIVVTQALLTPLFKQSFRELILIESKVATNNSIDYKLPSVKGDDIAYVIYTSGSSGKPKGVPISHQNIINSTGGRLAYYRTNPEVFLLMSSISFDSSKAGIFWTLCTGGNLIITENRIEQEISKIENLIDKHSVTHTLMLPSLYKLVLEYGSESKLNSLNTVIVAGEVCSPSVLELHFGKLPDVNLYNEYGPTEATVWCTAHHVSLNDGSTVVPIGKPVAGAQIYLLDESRNVVPFGAIGEIYVGGTGLTKGYFNRPELSEKAFINHSFDQNLIERLYKTGDLGRFRKDGAIAFLGRADQQVKIRGYRIELDEIERAIQEISTITDAVVMVEEIDDHLNVLEIDNVSDVVQLAEILKANLTDSELHKLLNSVEALENEQNM